MPGAISVVRTPVPLSCLAQRLGHAVNGELGRRVERSWQRARARDAAGQHEVALALASSRACAARIVSAGPSTFVSTISRQCSGDSSSKPRAAPKPALAKTASRRPKRSIVAATARLLIGRNRSHRSCTASAYARRRVRTARARVCRRERAASATRQPAATAARAVAAPIPVEAPVISSTRPSPPRVLLNLSSRPLASANARPPTYRETRHFGSVQKMPTEAVEDDVVKRRHDIPVDPRQQALVGQRRGLPDACAPAGQRLRSRTPAARGPAPTSRHERKPARRVTDLDAPEVNDVAFVATDRRTDAPRRKPGPPISRSSAPRIRHRKFAVGP